MKIWQVKLTPISFSKHAYIRYPVWRNLLGDKKDI